MSFALRTRRRHQPRHGSSPIRNHHLAPLPDFLDESGQVVASLSESRHAHAVIVIHVTHRVKAGPRWRVQVNVKNASDTAYFDAAPFNIIPQPPREVVLGLTRHF